MRKTTRPKIGAYCLLTRWSDKDPKDPWFVGFINAVGEDSKGMFYRVDGIRREMRHCWKITPEEGNQWIEDNTNKTIQLERTTDRTAKCPHCSSLVTKDWMELEYKCPTCSEHFTEYQIANPQ